MTTLTTPFVWRALLRPPTCLISRALLQVRPMACFTKRSLQSIVTILLRRKLPRVNFSVNHQQRTPLRAVVETSTNRFRAHLFLSAARGWRPKHHALFQSRGFCGSSGSRARVARASGDGRRVMRSGHGCQLHLQVSVFELCSGRSLAAICLFFAYLPPSLMAGESMEVPVTIQSQKFFSLFTVV